jgi:hypothetical protein
MSTIGQIDAIDQRGKDLQDGRTGEKDGNRFRAVE